MNKVKLLKPINVILFFSFVIQALTGIMIFFHIKLIKPRFIFEVHEYNGLVMIIVALTHITLNFGWVKSNFFKKNTPPQV